MLPWLCQGQHMPEVKREKAAAWGRILSLCQLPFVTFYEIIKVDYNVFDSICFAAYYMMKTLKLQAKFNKLEDPSCNKKVVDLPFKRHYSTLSTDLVNNDR